MRYEARLTPDVHQNEECVDQKYGGEREEKVAQSGLKKELKLKGWACCNGQRRWGEKSIGLVILRLRTVFGFTWEYLVEYWFYYRILG